MKLVYIPIWLLFLFCFWIGTIWGNNEEKITAFVKEKYWMCLTGSILLTAFFCGMFLLNYGELIGKLLWRNIGTVCFAVMMTIIFMIVKLNNKISEVLGTISLEIYLVHSLFIWYVIRYDNKVMAVYVSIIATILLSLTVCPMINRIVNGLNRLCG